MDSGIIQENETMNPQEITKWMEEHGITDSELDYYLKARPFSSILWRFGRKPVPGWLRESLELLEQRLDAEYFVCLEGR